MTGRAARSAVSLLLTAAAVTTSGCTWHGLNSLPLPGTAGGGAGSYVVQAQLPDVHNIQQNSRVRVGDVTVGNVVKIERQGWHALVTMRLQGDVDLPENATATIGQTSLLGSMHIELAPPKGAAPVGKLHPGALIPLAAGSSYPSTEQTLAAICALLNGGGVGQIQEIVESLSTAFAGRENDLKSLFQQLNTFTANLNGQIADIIAATDSLNNVTGQLAAQKPVIDRAIKTIPDALAVLTDQREHLSEAVDKFGELAAITGGSVDQTKGALIDEFGELGPILASLANAGPAMTRSLSFLATFPWPNETMRNWVRGDYGNLTAVIDLTLSRIDASLFTGTRWEGQLTELEMQWGRTIGQMPSPYTAVNPLVVPYHFDQDQSH